MPANVPREDVQIELVDTPPLTPDHVPTGLLGTIRNADRVCVVVEAGEGTLEQVECLSPRVNDGEARVTCTGLPGREAVLVRILGSISPGPAAGNASIEGGEAGRPGLRAFRSTSPTSAINAAWS